MSRNFQFLAVNNESELEATDVSDQKGFRPVRKRLSSTNQHTPLQSMKLWSGEEQSMLGEGDSAVRLAVNQRRRVLFSERAAKPQDGRSQR